MVSRVYCYRQVTFLDITQEWLPSLIPHRNSFLPGCHTVSTFQCTNTLKSRGQGPKKMENYWTKLSRTFNTNLDLVPWIGEEPYTQMLIWYFSNNLDIYDYVGKLPEQHFSVWLFSNQGDKILFLLKFNEARISEWNVCKI